MESQIEKSDTNLVLKTSNCFVSAQQKSDSIDVFLDSFSKKFTPLDRFPKSLKSLLQDCMADDRCIVISQDEELAAVVGYSMKKKRFFKIELSSICKQYGSMRGFYYWSIIQLLHKKPTKRNTIFIEALAVSPNFRGEGLGRKLIYEVSKLAEQQKIKKIRLEVVNSNERALRMYQRCGFRVKSTQKIHLLTKFLGFSKVYLMEKNIR